MSQFIANIVPSSDEFPSNSNENFFEKTKFLSPVVSLFALQYDAV